MNQVSTDVKTRSAKRAVSWKLAKRNWLPSFISKPIFGQAMAPTSEEWYAVKDALYQGDPAMDAVVDWFFENSPRESKALFEQALTQGIDSLDNPPEPLTKFFALIDAKPTWFNSELAEAGLKASRLPGEVAFYVLRDMALMGGYAYFNTMNQTLGMAGALHKNTSLRIGETAKWLNDVSDANGLDRFSNGFISTIRVRLIHALVRRHLQTKSEWKTADWGIPINQMDMLATYLAFGPVTLSGVRLFGVFPTRQESRASLHAWRYIGWLSGVDDCWLAKSERDGLRKLYHTFLTHSCPDDKIKLMGESLKREPLSRPIPTLANFPLLEKMGRHYNYHKHLSNSSFILSPLRKKQLGLPVFTLPWYPLLTALPRFIKISYYRAKGAAAFEQFLQRNRAKQIALVDVYFGDREKDLLRPDADHPAHVG